MLWGSGWCDCEASVLWSRHIIEYLGIVSSLLLPSFGKRHVWLWDMVARTEYNIMRMDFGRGVL